MTQRRYRLRGTTEPPASHDWLLVLKKQHPELRHRTVVPGRARDGATGEIEIVADEVVRVELENGFELWTRAEDLFLDYGRVTTPRDAAPVWELDSITPARAPTPASREARGIASVAIKVLEFFGYDVTKKTAYALCKTFEERTFRKSKIKGPGLYRCALDDASATLSLAPVTKVPAGQDPVLIFIHGTFSSFSHGFGALWAADNVEGASARQRLKELYGNRVYAYEHRTLTESPLQNAVELAELLPANANIHLVTHSRGGMVGELLCLGACDQDAMKPSDSQWDTLFKADRTTAPQLGLSALSDDDEKARNEAYQKDRQYFKKLTHFRLTIQRFVRVAAPVRGTTLASGRLDRWLSVLNDLSSRLLPVPFLNDSMDFLFAVVKERTDPRTLPGLEAMMPGSALTRLLNHPSLISDSDLTVIAGDIAGDSLWQRFKVLLTDWFYGAEHDLVVNTASMVGGFKRKANGARYAKDQGAEVDHFHYFANARTVRWLVAGLTRKDSENAGFVAITEAQQEEPKWRSLVARSRDATDRRPLAILIPGTMGSHLKVHNDHVWLNYRALFCGGLEKLGWGAAGIEPSDTIDGFYGPLLEFLTRTHRVEVFSYDWRDSVQEAARKLALKIKDWLPRVESEQQAVHLVAHSMGGLVARAMLAHQPLGAGIGQRIKQLPNSRMLMLGTPNRGSYEAVRWLTGFNPTQTKLALLDFAHGMDEIIDIVRQYPGLLELLPFGEHDVDFSDQKRWKTIKAELRADWKVADAVPLRQTRATWDLLKTQAGDREFMRYVAGCQPATVAGYRIVEHDLPLLPPTRRLEFDATRQGDGTVTWASGRLADVPMWYVEDTAHDNLCVQTRAFVGYLDLLMTGRTTRLLAVPPAANREATEEPVLFPLPMIATVDYVPTEQEVLQLGFGGASPQDVTVEAAYAPVIEVSVCHGDLSYARYPVLVGHYLGDTVVSAERMLDRQLGRTLTQRLELGIYPGRLGTYASFFNGQAFARPKGAIVIGLGQVGELSPSLLESGACAALLDFALQIAQWPDARFGLSGAVRSAAISCLFVGSGAAGLGLRDSIESILRAALAANDRLVKADLNHKVIIDRIEFVELYQDVAIAACDALRVALADGPLAMNIRWQDNSLLPGAAPRRRVRFDDAPEWWQRLEILEEKTADRALRFIFATDRARAEETMATGQLTLAEGFIKEASQSPSTNSEAARTLFEMLLPLRLREMAPKQQNMILQLDEYSARFPWELLENRWSHNGRPPAVQAGMLRQLKAVVFREQPAHSDTATALVIGNPDLTNSDKFAELPGARAEAQSVANLLGQNGYQVQDSIDEKKDSILHKLHRRAWRILHLAGHGVHEYSRPSAAQDATAGLPLSPQSSQKLISGMVIGPEDFLTPGDVAQLRWVPELVFVNCCHLGKTLSTRMLDRAGLAANLGVEFIRMGARAVVVAGWAVDDGAATTFAQTFYSQMLTGSYFGDAVRSAREATRSRHPNVNTWGAYQCYGDPNFALVRAQQPSVWKAAPLCTPAELVVALDNLASALKAGGDGVSTDFEKTVNSIIERVPNQNSDWLMRGDVAAALGLAYGEARRWELAIEALDNALIAELGDLPLRVLEQRANYRVRLAADTFRSLLERRSKDLGKQSLGVLANMTRSIGELEQLLAMGETTERLNLVGAAHKRSAFVYCALGDSSACAIALDRMQASYRAALEKTAHAGQYSSGYSYSNWATASLLCALREGKPVNEHLVELDTAGALLVEKLQRACDAEPDFWNSAALGDIAIVRVLARSRALSKDRSLLAAQMNEVIAAYHAPIARGASPRQISSIRENLEFVIGILKGTPARSADLKPVIDGIERIHATLANTGV